MAVNPNDNEFWDLVEHEMKVKQGSSWRMTMLLLRGGMSIVLFAASYMLMRYLLKPPSGYFVTSLENALHPIFWMIAGVLFIIAGAYLRFRAMGPIIEHLKLHGPR